MSDAVPGELKINEEVCDPEKQIQASFIILLSTDTSDLLDNPKIVSTSLDKMNIGTQ